MDVGNDTLRVHSYVLLVARSNKQLSNCVVRIVAHVETFGDATFGRATRWREDSWPFGTLWQLSSEPLFFQKNKKTRTQERQRNQFVASERKPETKMCSIDIKIEIRVKTCIWVAHRNSLRLIY